MSTPERQRERRERGEARQKLAAAYGRAVARLTRRKPPAAEARDAKKAAA